MGRTKKEVTKPTTIIENRIRSQGYGLVAGVDEAGMSSIAGPVIAGAVVLHPDQNIDGLNDSKILSEEERERLYAEIITKALDFAVGIVSVEQINIRNIYWASRDAMVIAIRKLKPIPDFLLIDGGQALNINIIQDSIIKGDSKCSCIAAASILAKVTLDRIMRDLHKQYPHYNWWSNKGYPSPEHRRAIAQHGITEHHRLGFAGVIKQGAWKENQGLGEGNVFYAE